MQNNDSLLFHYIGRSELTDTIFISPSLDQTGLLHSCIRFRRPMRSCLTRPASYFTTAVLPMQTNSVTFARNEYTKLATLNARPKPTAVNFANETVGLLIKLWLMLVRKSLAFRTDPQTPTEWCNYTSLTRKTSKQL